MTIPSYTCRYKKPGWLFWRTIKNVKGDAFLNDVGYRIILCEDETRYEIPLKDMIIQFGKDREIAIRMSNIQKEKEEIPKKS